MSGIRHIAADATRDDLFLTAEFEHRVSAWSFARRELVAELETVMDFGGTRLALCRSGTDPVVVAGAYERHGICAYGLDGALLWQRKDLRKVQQLAPARRGDLVVACFDERPVHVLAASSGETVATVRAIRRFFPSRHAEIALGEALERVVLVDAVEWKVRWRASMEDWCILCAAAAPDAFAAGSQSSVTCWDLHGDVLWRWPTPQDVNCPAIAWNGDWVGMLNHLNGEEPDTLARWAPDGELLSRHPLGLFSDYAFLPSGDHLVTSDGAVRDSRDGTVVWQPP